MGSQAATLMYGGESYMSTNATTIATSLFQFTTSATPAQVWGALTRPELTARYLFGMSLQSDWRAGSTVVVEPPPESGLEHRLGGEVLAVEDGRRLSYTLSSGPAEPATFVTWEIEPSSEGAKVSLYVDETQAFATPDEEVDGAWLQAVTALRTTLARLLR